jgi:small subunit ribosomal protein S9
MEIINALGRRKTAVARIYMKDGQGQITVNGRDYKDYFPTPILQFKVTEPFEVTNNQGKYDLKVNLDGGGIRGQAEALALAIARALCEVNEEHRPPLKAKGLLMRDPRMVERKKFGQKKAR